jgi:TIR domain
MAAVHGFRHDVFVSYAHSDNVPVAGARTGFVSQLVADLRTEIGRKVDSKSLDIWWDHYNLAGNTRVTPEIMAAAAQCAAIVVVASPAYLRSEWCGRERHAFFQALERASGSSQAVFIVSIEPIDQTKFPVDLRDFRGYEFYRALEDGRTTRPLRTEITSDIEPYNNRLSQLVQNVADHLERLLTRPPITEEAPRLISPADPSKPSVLLLEVTDDLVQRRAELKDYLEQLGVTVLPEKRYSRDDMALHRRQMLADLAHSRACVQILGPLTGDRSDHPRGMTWLRYESIRDSGSHTPFLQWRDPDLDLGLVTDPDARTLIVPASVRTDRFPDFRRSIGELALKRPPVPKVVAEKNRKSVFVNSDLLDRNLGAGVAEWLEAHDFMVLEPPHSTVDAREEWEANLRYCDSLLLVYGQTKPGWVRTQILLSNKVNRENPLKLLGVCIGPPPDPAHDKTTDLAVRDSRIHYVRNEDSPQPNPVEMERFAARLREVYAND